MIDGTETTHLQVQYQASGRAYSYAIPEALQGHVQVGHAVQIEPTPQGTEWARVVGFGSTYAGQCKQVVGIIDETDKTAAEQELDGQFIAWRGAAS
jgi:hypothetical protein